MRNLQCASQSKDVHFCLCLLLLSSAYNTVCIQTLTNNDNNLNCYWNLAPNSNKEAGPQSGSEIL